MKSVRVVLVCFLCVFHAGCWFARTAHDRPELRANVGRKVVLTEPYGLFRDRGGRLHLEKGEPPASYVLIERLSSGSTFEIRDVVYRVSDPGRRDYYVVEIATASGRYTVEVPAGERERPAWRYETKG